MQLALKTAEWLQVAGAAISLVAALASWAAVAQARKIWRSRLLPELHAQEVSILGRNHGDPNRTRFAVHNSGGALAIAAGFGFVSNGIYVRGLFSDGFVRPGETFHVTTEIEPGESDAQGVIFCRDADKTLYAWSLRHEAKLWKKRRLRFWRRIPSDWTEIFAEFYSDVDIRVLTEEQHPGVAREGAGGGGGAVIAF
jgi:archaellum component FlaF (FlaF/FlaG flagellin family)